MPDLKYNHAFDIAFEVKSDNTGENVTAQELMDNLKKRVKYFENNMSELFEACGLPYDTFEED